MQQENEWRHYKSRVENIPSIIALDPHGMWRLHKRCAAKPIIAASMIELKISMAVHLATLSQFSNEERRNH